MNRRKMILDFWFGSRDAVFTGDVSKEVLAQWFNGGTQLDRQIREKFGDDLQRASRGDYDDWTENLEGHLALIVVLDQFSRNIHRGTARAFAFDDQALEYALDAIDEGHDQEVSPVARVFFYLPLEHAEQLGHQQRCVELMEQLVDDAPDDQRELFETYAEYARQHRDIIERFGRFPHRNELLERESNPEELAYLEDTDHTFAQTSEKA